MRVAGGFPCETSYERSRRRSTSQRGSFDRHVSNSKELRAAWARERHTRAGPAPPGRATPDDRPALSGSSEAQGAADTLVNNEK